MSAINDRITLTREINRSGIATVWEGYDTVLDRKVLVKAIHPQFAHDRDIRTRFEREARAIARISHPNVVQIYDVEIQDERLRLILEFVEGATLGTLLKERKRFPSEIALSIACNILLGLKHAHAEGIIHRDLKPDNILISLRGETKITDFGMATLKDQPTVTLEGSALGTPSYWAPEQALGSALSERTDLFTAGLILFEMLTGRRVIEGESLGETYQNAVNYRTPDLSQYEDCISAEVMPILQSLMERDSSKRFESASTAFESLRESTAAGILPTASIGNYLAGESYQEFDALSKTTGPGVLRTTPHENRLPGKSLQELSAPAKTTGKSISGKIFYGDGLTEKQGQEEEIPSIPKKFPGHGGRRVGMWIAGVLAAVAVIVFWQRLPVSAPPVTQSITADTTQPKTQEQPVTKDSVVATPKSPI
jgi:serine/threonine protein kinase